MYIDIPQTYETYILVEVEFINFSQNNMARIHSKLSLSIWEILSVLLIPKCHQMQMNNAQYYHGTYISHVINCVQFYISYHQQAPMSVRSSGDFYQDGWNCKLLEVVPVESLS